MVQCPECQSEKIRRGGMTTWLLYMLLIALALVAVLVFEYNAAIVAGVMIAVILLANLLLDQRVCLGCGHQWREKQGPQRQD